MKLLHLNKICIVIFCLLSFFSKAQNESVIIKENGANNSILHINTATRGVLFPRLKTITRENMFNSPNKEATGLLVYDINLSSYYYYNGLIWKRLGGQENKYKIKYNDQKLGFYVNNSLVSDVVLNNIIVNSSVFEGNFFNLGIKKHSILSNYLEDNIVDSLTIIDEGVESIDIANGSISNSKLSPALLGKEGQLLSLNSLGELVWIDNTVLANLILNNKSIGSSEIINGSISEKDYAKNTISNEKIVDQSIGFEKIAYNTITAEKIPENAIINSKILDSSVKSVNIIDQEVKEQDIQDGAITSEKIAKNTFKTNQIQDNYITSNHLTESCIVNSHIDDSAVESQHIKDGEIKTNNIADNSFSLNTNVISANKFYSHSGVHQLSVNQKDLIELSDKFKFDLIFNLGMEPESWNIEIVNKSGVTCNMTILLSYYVSDDIRKHTVYTEENVQADDNGVSVFLNFSANKGFSGILTFWDPLDNKGIIYVCTLDFMAGSKISSKVDLFYQICDQVNFMD